MFSDTEHEENPAAVRDSEEHRSGDADETDDDEDTTSESQAAPAADPAVPD